LVAPGVGAVEPLAAAALGEGASLTEEVVDLVNQERWKNGPLPPLKHEALLDSSSQEHSANMALRDFFAHCDLDTKTGPGERMTAAGYVWSRAGENIAAGYADAAAVVAAWMASSGHRANLLSTNFREFGVGYVHQTTNTNTVRLDANGDCNADSSNNGPYFPSART
jgi:uncharacterized protein YkwD